MDLRYMSFFRGEVGTWWQDQSGHEHRCVAGNDDWIIYQFDGIPIARRRVGRLDVCGHSEFSGRLSHWYRAIQPIVNHVNGVIVISDVDYKAFWAPPGSRDLQELNPSGANWTTITFGSDLERLAALE